MSTVPNQPKTPVRSVRMSDDIWLPLKALAEDEGVTVSDILRDLVETRLYEAGS